MIQRLIICGLVSLLMAAAQSAAAINALLSASGVGALRAAIATAQPLRAEDLVSSVLCEAAARLAEAESEARAANEQQHTADESR